MVFQQQPIPSHSQFGTQLFLDRSTRSSCVIVEENARTPATVLVAGRKILAFLPSGTASNEALHGEVKSWFLQTQQMHQSTLRLKLSILGLAKVLPHVSAVHHPTISQLSSQLLLARITARSVWSDAAWEDWCMSCIDNDRHQKAFLPNYTSRTADVEKVRKWNLKRPAAPKKTLRKRAVFTAERASCLRSQGARRRQ